MKTCKKENCTFPVFSKMLCKAHWKAEFGKPINKLSDKQKKILAGYKILRIAYMKTHPDCEAKRQGCARTATDIHHVIPKRNADTWLNDGNFMAVCRSCHDWIHTHDAEARELGLLKSKL